MIFVDNTFDPLAVVGVLPDATPVPADLGCEPSRLWSSKQLLVVLVVPGGGPSAMSACLELLEWLRGQRLEVRRRARRVAWVVEDGTLRSFVGRWLDLHDGATCDVGAQVFGALLPAFAWVRGEGVRRALTARVARARLSIRN